MEFFHDTANWVFLSFLLFAFLLVKFGGKAFIGLLDKRIADIRKDIDTAESLRVEAQELLAQYQRKQKDAEKEAEEIVANAKEHAKNIKKQADEELKIVMARKEKQLAERLERMEHEAMAEIQAYAAELTVKATTEIVAANMNKKTSDTLLKKSLDNVAASIK